MMMMTDYLLAEIVARDKIRHTESAKIVKPSAKTIPKFGLLTSSETQNNTLQMKCNIATATLTYKKEN